MKRTPQTYRIIVEEFIESTRDALNAPTGSWSTFAQPYASVSYPQSTEKEEGQRNTATTIANFKIGYDSDTKNITTKMRINFDGEIWEITGRRLFGRNDAIILKTFSKDR